jgi:hypothetical protein
MITPVTETYIQGGQVQRAIRRCSSNRPLAARKMVRNAIGTMMTARIVWESRMAR